MDTVTLFVVKSGNTVLYKTLVKQKTLNPVWEENFSFPLPCLGQPRDNKIIFELKDEELIGASRSLGVVEFSLKQCQPLSTNQNRPFHFDLPIEKAQGANATFSFTVILDTLSFHEFFIFLNFFPSFEILQDTKEKIPNTFSISSIEPALLFNFCKFCELA